MDAPVISALKFKLMMDLFEGSTPKLTSLTLTEGQSPGVVSNVKVVVMLWDLTAEDNSIGHCNIFTHLICYVDTSHGHRHFDTTCGDLDQWQLSNSLSGRHH